MGAVESRCAKKYGVETPSHNISITLISFTLSQLTKHIFEELNLDTRWESIKSLSGSPMERLECTGWCSGLSHNNCLLRLIVMVAALMEIVEQVESSGTTMVVHHGLYTLPRNWYK